VGLAEIGDADAMIVVEARGRTGLAMKAGHRLGVGGQLPAQDLDRHRLVHQRVGGAIDGAHAALAQSFGQTIPSAQDPSDQRIGHFGRSAGGGRVSEGRSVARTEMLLALEVRVARGADEQSIPSLAQRSRFASLRRAVYDRPMRSRTDYAWALVPVAALAL